MPLGKCTSPAMKTFEYSIDDISIRRITLEVPPVSPQHSTIRRLVDFIGVPTQWRQTSRDHDRFQALWGCRQIANSAKPTEALTQDCPFLIADQVCSELLSIAHDIICPKMRQIVGLVFNRAFHCETRHRHRRTQPSSALVE